jgi:hypothetical protein
VPKKFNDAIDLAGNELQNVIQQNLSADPATYVADGRLYYSTALGALRLRAGGAWTTISSGTVTPGSVNFSASPRLLGRATAGAGTGEEITLNADVEFSGGALRVAAYSGGDITKAAGATSATIINSAVTNAKLANMAANTLKANPTGSAAAPTDITLASDLAFSGTTLQTAAFTGDVTKAAGGTALAIASAATGGTANFQTAVAVDQAQKQAVRVVSTANVAVGTGTLLTIDGVTLVAGDRVLLTGQTTTTENGIWVAATGAWTRAADMASGLSVLGVVVPVFAGTTYAGTEWIQTDTAARVVGTNALSFAQTSPVAGTGLTLTGRSLAVNYGTTSTTALVGNSTLATIAAANASTGAITASSQKITNLANGTVATDAAAFGQIPTAGTGASNYTPGNATVGGDLTGTLPNPTVANSAITNAKMANMAATTLKANPTGSPAAPSDITLGASLAFSGTTLVRADLTGDVTTTSNGNATTIAANAVTNAKAAQMAANTIKGNNTGATANAADLTVAQTKTLLAIVPGDISGFDTQVRTSTLNQMAAPTADLSMNTHKITNLVDGTAATDAATFGQLNSILQGQTWKQPVAAATTANIATLAGGAPNVVDGYTVVAGDRILVKNQTTTSQNGIYTVSTVGTGANGTWVRATDMDAAAEYKNGTVLVENGTTQIGDIYTETATVATVGTDAVTWVKTSDTNTVYTADGTTITLTGTQFSVTNGGIGATQLATGAFSATGGITGGGGTAAAINVGTGIEIASNAVRISTGAAGNGLQGGGGSALSIKLGTNPGLAVGAGGITVDRATNGQKVAWIYAVALVGGATTETITHNLGSNDVIVRVYNQTAGVFADEEFSIERPTTNTVLIRSSTTIPASTYRAVVLG